MSPPAVLRRVRRSAARAALRALGDQPPAGSAPVGLVEEFSSRLIVGWVAVPIGSPPTLITLQAADLQISATYATPGGALPRPGRRKAGGTSLPVGADLPHQWQLPMVRGPVDGRRNSDTEVRTFSFKIREIWAYLGPRTPVTVRVGGRPLPIYRHGMFLSPPRRGRKQLDDLRTLIDDGYVLMQSGKIALSKQLDTTWQSTVTAVYERTRRIVREAYGYEPFLCYGTLLGMVREGGYIGHDVDFDAAYISRHRTGEEARQELVDIALLLIENGLRVDCRSTVLHVWDPALANYRIDLFHTWFDTDGLLRFPFGIAGTTTFGEAQWKGTRPITFPGGTGL
ncbi:MAG: hypothetical protein ACRCYQ_04015, partial [Nocardioides sp.]